MLHFEQGVYFARDARYSNNYCERTPLGEKKMLVCKVIVGDYCIGNSGMTKPPPKSDGIGQYDTMADSLYNPSIFVITKDYHAIPKYIITLKAIRNLDVF